ncbi:acyltransferase family protein [Tunturiibacter gelidiferens]|uniref:acyltransferase family protein n=1 Tax=Tunturiibacter gelidiferens TaxID=3069689 RepID=UPI003D9BD84F
MNRRIPGLDGLRALSAVGVALRHLGVLPIGWIGVQVFYVLSGFLITGILLSSKDEIASFSERLKHFYARRSLRILPLYFAYLFFVFVASYLNSEFRDQRALLWSLATYTYNIHRVLHPTDAFSLCTHLWSLSIEEQFYFGWPFIVFFMSTKHFRIFAMTVVALSPLLRATLVLTSHDPHLDAYFLTPYQLDGFAAGAVLSTLSISQLMVLRKPFAVVLAAAVACSLLWNAHILWFGLLWLMPNGHASWTWGYTLIDLLAAAMIIECICGAPLVSILEWTPLRYLGRISYGFYVWHAASIILFVHIFHRLRLISWLQPGGLLLMLGFLAFNTLISTLSFRLLERPSIVLKDRIFQKQPKTILA